MLQCFAAAQLDPTPFLNPNATLLSDRFPMIGDSMANADNFCRLVNRLLHTKFPYLRPVFMLCGVLLYPFVAFRLISLNFCLYLVFCLFDSLFLSIASFLLSRTGKEIFHRDLFKKAKRSCQPHDLSISWSKKKKTTKLKRSMWKGQN